MNVGDYVRTKEGRIDKIINPDYYMARYIECENGIIDRENIYKSSPNTIDLIEENDLIKYRIHGDLYVSEVQGHPEFDKYKLHIEYSGTIINLEDLDIVSIATKEQFESMEYKVGE